MEIGTHTEIKKVSHLEKGQRLHKLKLTSHNLVHGKENANSVVVPVE